jgi:outer membrane receptor protein involved in Fe transport
LEAVTADFLRVSVLLALISALLLTAAAASPNAIQPGMPLAEALRLLEGEGLKLVWSSLLVPPELTVATPPVAIEPAARLVELLAPFGLGVDRHGGTWIVVRGPAREGDATLRGRVRSQRAFGPLAGVEIRILELGRAADSGPDGAFEIRGIPPGRYRVQARRSGYVIDEPIAVELAAGAALELGLLLLPAPFAGEEIDVQPSRYSLLLDEPVSPLALSRDEIEELPHLAGDVFRALDLLPGAVANDISAEVQVRGGRRDETLVFLDGQEIYDAFHLKDFDNALSLVPAPTIDLLELSTGALPASRGDRMGAALELTTFAPADPERVRLSASLIDLQAEASGRSQGGLSWLGSLRYGNGALVGALLDNEDPVFWDLFAKGERAFGERQSLRASLLASEDDLDFTEISNGETRRITTGYGNRYLWLTHQALLSERSYVDSGASLVLFDRDRRGAEDEEEKIAALRDEREIEVMGVQQAWGFDTGSGGTWGAGFEARRYDAFYDYANDREFRTPLAGLRTDPENGETMFRGRVVDEALGAWASNRFRPGEDVTLELGARYDRHTASDDTIWSPRAALAWGVGAASVMRLAAGRHTQSQRAYELMVTDGDTRIYPVEKARHAVLGFEHQFSAERSRALSAFRVEAYDHRIETPRPRYENVLEPFDPFAELGLDRARIEPEEARSRGIELLVHGRPTKRFGWWINYAWARTEDLLDGRWTPRTIDQRHTLNADLTVRLSRAWTLNLAARYHSGRPTTPVELAIVPIPHDPGEPPPDDDEEDGGEESHLTLADHEDELHPGLGRLNSERLPEYYRLDLRLSRGWLLRRGELSFYFDVQNLFDRANVSGYDVELDDEIPAIVLSEEPWPGFLASAGVSWEF